MSTLVLFMVLEWFNSSVLRDDDIFRLSTNSLTPCSTVSSIEMFRNIISRLRIRGLDCLRLSRMRAATAEESKKNPSMFNFWTVSLLILVDLALLLKLLHRSVSRFDSEIIIASLSFPPHLGVLVSETKVSFDNSE